MKKKRELNKDRLFFNDVINQTHGILLYLNHKSSLGPSEIDLVKSEVKTLQALVQNHYQLTHKNLDVANNNVTSCEELKSSLATLITLYLPHSNVTSEITYSMSNKENASFDFVIFYRILNNIVKNMAEEKISSAVFHFDYQEKGLVIETKNSISQDTLSSFREGIGLSSMASLAHDAGGFFHYEIHHNLWYNHIFIPYKMPSQMKKIAA